MKIRNLFIAAASAGLLTGGLGACGGKSHDDPTPQEDGGIIVTDGGTAADGGSGGDAGQWLPPECGNDQLDPGEECDGTPQCGEDCKLLPDIEEGKELSCSDTSNNCCISGSGSKLLIQGDILTGDKIIKGGSVLVGSSGKIECVGAECSSDGATVITCPDSVVSAAFINAHEHIGYAAARPDSWGEERFDHRNDWRRNKNGHTNHNGQQTNNNVVGELRMIMGGAVSIFGSGSEKGLMRNIDVDSADLGIDAKNAIYDTFPLGDTKGAQVALGGGCSSYTVSDKAKKYINGTKDYGPYECPYGPHVAEGINSYALNELYCVSGQDKDGIDLFREKSAFIHGVGATPDYIAMMAASGVKLIWSPRSNISLYGDTALATTYDRLGVTIGLGTDWIYSGSMNVLRELQCVDSLNKNNFGGYFSDRKIWKMATKNNAVALGVDGELGDIKVGLWGDISVFKTYPDRQHYRAVIDAGAQDVLLVTRAGKILYGDANVVTGSGCEDVKGTDLKGSTFTTVCGTAKKVCVKDETGSNFATLLGYAHSKTNGKTDKNVDTSYELFFCSVPDDEPTCVPQRTRKVDTTDQKTTNYTGVPAEGDRDGDGIPDSEDNCPDVFNPVRPNDDKNSALGQDDYDNDGLGDPCDPYPTCKENNSTCPITVDPSQRDSDGDGVIDTEDNCPADKNPDQKDDDHDGKGDVCDDCPDIPNPGDARCPIETETSIASIMKGEVVNIAEKCSNKSGCSTGVEVLVRGTVSAVAPNGFFIQDPSISSGEYAGLYVYGVSSKPQLNDSVKVQGFIGAHYDQVELLDKPTWELISHNAAAIEPVEVAASDVNAKGSKFNSVLVKLIDVEVTKAADANNIWTVSDGEAEVGIDDFIGYKGAPEVGDVYSAITGIVVYDFSASKVAPRSAADLTAGAVKPKLASLKCPEKVRESAEEGAAVGTCTVTLAKAMETATQIQISSEGGIGVLARSVSIPAGGTSAQFDISAKDIGAKSPSVTVWIGTSSEMPQDGFLTAQLSIVGKDVKPTAITMSGAESVPEDGNIELTLTLDNPSAGEFEVTLNKDQECGTLSAETLVFAAEELTAKATFDATGCAVGTEINFSSAPTIDVAEFTPGKHTVTVVEAPAGTHVVINQIMSRGAAAGDEFVELYNPTRAAVDLSTYVLWRSTAAGSTYATGFDDDATFKLELSGSIPAGGYYLIAANNGLAAFTGVTADITDSNGNGICGGLNKKSALWLTSTKTPPATVSADNVVDIVGMKAASGSDQSAVSETAHAVNPDSSNKSIIRKGEGQDTDDNSADFESKEPACPRNKANTTGACPAMASSGS